MRAPLEDAPHQHPVRESRIAFSGRVWDVVTDSVDLGVAGIVTRDYVAHPGAVAIMAMDHSGEVYLVRQYRHPMRRELWEPPAGLLDEPGESPLEAAKRELWEEADLEAATWHVLTDYATSPGGSAEGIRIYLARDLTEVAPEQRHRREAEESTMVGAWVEVDRILAGALAGSVWGPTTIVGAFSLDYARRHEWEPLRPHDAPWDYVPGTHRRP